MITIKVISAFLILLAIFVKASAEISPSFDCNKAKTKIEKAICSSEILSEYDKKMGEYYFRYASHLSTNRAERLKCDQRLWLQDRESCIQSEEVDIVCLENMYISRMGMLSKLADNPSAYLPMSLEESIEFVKIRSEKKRSRKQDKFEQNSDFPEKPESFPKNNQKTFSVNTAKQLLAAIGSDRTIEICKDINLSDAIEEFNNLTLEYVKNIKLIGIGDHPIKVLTNDKFADVILFKDSENIEIENLFLAHQTPKGHCGGDVLEFSHCNTIKISDSVLFGSGAYGLGLSNVRNMTFWNSDIRGCTYGIMQLADCKNVTFRDSRFFDNEEFSLIDLSLCTNIQFENCQITDNRGQYLLDFLEKFSSVIFKNCSIKDNMFEIEGIKTKWANGNNVKLIASLVFSGTEIQGNLNKSGQEISSQLKAKTQENNIDIRLNKK